MSGPGFADQELGKRVSASILRIRTTNPFFGALALFTNIVESTRVDTAATNGREIYLNPPFCGPLSNDQLGGLLLHEILHCALEHVGRRTTREPELWNIAADIVVNGMIRNAGNFALPKGSVEDESLEHLSVEEIYLRLSKQSDRPSCAMADLDTSGWAMGGMLDEQRQREIAEHWRMARTQATALARRYGFAFGSEAGNEWRDFEMLGRAKVDWRTALWEYLARTPSDFSGFDRRFVGQGLYLDALESESLELWVAVDTSGSIDSTQLADFLAEIESILAVYPRAKANLYFADADVYGPYPFDANTSLPAPVGGGGTSFAPFFAEMATAEAQPGASRIAVYFTDGYGEFPISVPDMDVLWVVTEDGLESDQFPFGSVIRLS